MKNEHQDQVLVLLLMKDLIQNLIGQKFSGLLDYFNKVYSSVTSAELYKSTNWGSVICGFIQASGTITGSLESGSITFRPSISIVQAVSEPAVLFFTMIAHYFKVGPINFHINQHGTWIITYTISGFPKIISVVHLLNKLQGEKHTALWIINRLNCLEKIKYNDDKVKFQYVNLVYTLNKESMRMRKISLALLIN